MQLALVLSIRCTQCRLPRPAPTPPFWKKLVRLPLWPVSRLTSWQRKQSAKLLALNPPKGGPLSEPTAKERLARSRRALLLPCGPLGPESELRALPCTSAVASLLWQSVQSTVLLRLSGVPSQALPWSCPPALKLSRTADWFLPTSPTGWKERLVGWNSRRLLDPDGGRVEAGGMVSA